MNKTIFNLLKQKLPNVDITNWKKKAKNRYKEIIAEVDDIGDMMKNILRVSLSDGAVL